MVAGPPIFAAALITLVVICAIGRPDGWKRRLIELGLAVAVFFSVWILLLWDPLRVVEWYFD